jgi:hypothetical protein
MKTYLGDGAYARFDGFAVVLTTSDGIYNTNTIVLEPQVLVAFERWVAELRRSFVAQDSEEIQQ